MARALVYLSGRSDLIVAILMLVAIIMIIIPLPTWLVDGLIAINISVSMLILLVVFYIARPVEFSSFPSVILIATLFRLAITITTSRLILLQADAGEIVSAFGNFVIGGDIAVGLVVFLIITIAQFVVITKGGERVAEVAARFSLDAMPGKQMAIDNDLRSGDIDQAEANRLRRGLERESHLFGAMDGAMKFVKGDAIASILVVLVNLIGGMIIGSLKHGMTIGTAAETYALLSVGDGLVAQIPSLFVSVAAGVLVTRVSSDSDMGTEIAGQLFLEPRALVLGSVILVGMAFVPGFPAVAFLLLAAVLGFAGFLTARRKAALEAAVRNAPVKRAAGATAGTTAQPSQVGSTAQDSARLAGPPASDATIVVWVSSELASAVPPEGFAELTTQARAELLSDLGIEIPSIALEVDPTLAHDRFRIDLEGTPVIEGTVPPQGLLVDDEPAHLELLEIPYRQELPLISYRPALWVERSHAETLSQAGVAFALPAQILARCLIQMLYRRAGSFVGIQETRKLLTKIQSNYADLVKEAEKIAPLQKLAEILRRLVDENVPVRNMRAILEAVVEWGQREQNVVLLVEYVRVALGRQICFRCADRDRVIAAYMLERSVEDMLRSAQRQTAAGTYMNLTEEAVQPLVSEIARALAEAAPDAKPVVLTAMDVRRVTRHLLTRSNIYVPVMSYQELAAEFNVQPLGSLTKGSQAEEGFDSVGQSAERLKLEAGAR
ncbi:type III secretion system export apparatus subunit SctV [Bradyrhizobium roseum]|uniref:type III secretion system export apparatus subunit SctV n=1 Tax=Bradyrhizobium roseum TaxID=3056648 RepID=UPI00260A77B0|nr:type III secretion system export apparatus subunit SctV [Bradyrhizobium roseus]WKA30048.1 type III secretion system export apparatus subunit SctV [Bradyrhizobium roseus]